MKRLRKKMLCCLLFVVSAPALSRAQLADTIWEGTQWISSINLGSLKPNGFQDFPALMGARFNLPLEIWFWDNTRFGVVFRNDRWGFEGRRKGEYSGYHPNPPPDEDTSYTYRLRGGTGTFQATRFTDGVQKYAGRLSLRGNRLTTDRITYTAPDYLFQITTLAGYSIQRIGKLPVFDKTIWTKTNRRPSIAKNEPGYLTDP